MEGQQSSTDTICTGEVGSRPVEYDACRDKPENHGGATDLRHNDTFRSEYLECQRCAARHW